MTQNFHQSPLCALMSWWRIEFNEVNDCAPRLLDLDQDDDLDDDLLEPFGLSPDEPYPPSQFPVTGFPGPGSFPGIPGFPGSPMGSFPGISGFPGGPGNFAGSLPRNSISGQIEIPGAMAHLFSREDLALALEEPEEILKITEPFRLLPEKLKLNHPDLLTTPEDEMK